MQEYKLKYATKAAAEKDLITKEVIDQDLNLKQGTHAVVWLGQLVDTPAVFEGGKEVQKATYLDGYHVDIATDNEYQFSKGVEQHPANPKHLFWV